MAPPQYNDLVQVKNPAGRHITISRGQAEREGLDIVTEEDLRDEFGRIRPNDPRGSAAPAPAEDPGAAGEGNDSSVTATGEGQGDSSGAGTTSSASAGKSTGRGRSKGSEGK